MEISPALPTGQFQNVETWNIVDLLDRPDDPVPCWIEPAVLPKSGKLLFGGEAKTGKALADTEPVLTPDGWRPIGELKPGDLICTPAGEAVAVLAVQHFDSKPLRRVVFRDGRSVIAADDHLWEVTHYNWVPEYRLLTTDDLMNRVGLSRYSIPTVTGDFGTDVKPLFLDPYILGVYLGDGSTVSGTVNISTADQEIVQALVEYLGDGCLRYDGKYGYFVRDGGQVAGYLRALGLFGLRSYERFVPEAYLNGSRETRLGVLQGLLDTDGYVGEGGQIEYCTTSYKLAVHVQQLVWSLGGMCRLKVKPRSGYRDKAGEFVECRTAYRLHIRRENLTEFFRLSRRKLRCVQHKTPRMAITEIVPVSDGPATCIQIAHKDGLFVTRDYVVTHNSVIMLEMARALALGQPPFGCPALHVPAPLKVLVVEQEIGEWGLKKRASKIFAGENRELLQKNFFGVSKVRGLAVNETDSIKFLVELIHRTEAQVVFLDPIGKMHTYDENDNSQINRLFRRLDELIDACKGLQTSLVISHHFGKPGNLKDSRFGPDDEMAFSPYNFRGASKWFDDPDTLVVCRRYEAPTPSSWWKIKSKWVQRQGESLGYMNFSVNRQNDLRVRWEAEDKLVALGRR